MRQKMKRFNELELEIEELDKTKTYIFRVDDDWDLCRINELNDYLSSKGISALIVTKSIDIVKLDQVIQGGNNKNEPCDNDKQTSKPLP